MAKPTTYDLEVAHRVLEYCVADMRQNEPYAINSINDIEAVLGALPWQGSELGDVDDG